MVGLNFLFSMLDSSLSFSRSILSSYLTRFILMRFVSKSTNSVTSSNYLIFRLIGGGGGILLSFFAESPPRLSRILNAYSLARTLLRSLLPSTLLSDVTLFSLSRLVFLTCSVKLCLLNSSDFLRSLVVFASSRSLSILNMLRSSEKRFCN